MPIRVIIVVLLLPMLALATERRDEYYRRALAGTEQFIQRFNQPETAGDFTIYTLFDNIALLLSANVDLPKEQRPSLEPVLLMLRTAEEMQDKNPDSRTFGNFRWYWSSPGVTDPNAVEFAAARMLSIYLDTPDPLTEETRSILSQMLQRSASACLIRKVRPDYTNIALYNAIHLILLGQILERPSVMHEGKRRLQNIVISIWDHGIFEYNSPAYYFIDVDALQLGFRHSSDTQTRQMIHALLDLFWADLSLHWYKGGLRLAGAQSRTYNFLFGTSVPMTRILSFADLAPYDHQARYNAVLNSFRALYQPPPNIVQHNGQYPRWSTRNWGSDPGQWAATYICDDIALGTAGTKYDSQQNMVQTVDMPDEIAGSSQPRCYFIADGRKDPYGTESLPIGSAGQQKALHLDHLWFGTQRTVDSLGMALYPLEALADPQVKNVQSHFVVRKPESIWIENKPITLSPHQPVCVGSKPVIFRYKTCAFGVRAVWTRHLNGQPAEVFLLDDGNKHGVYRLTIDHGTPSAWEMTDGGRHTGAKDLGGKPVLPGAAFWLRIASHLESEEQFSDWRHQFTTANINRLNVRCNDVDIEIAGQEGIVSVKRNDSIFTTEPAAPMGILTLDGKDLGRHILEKIPEVARFAQRCKETKPIVVEPSGTYWESETGYSFFDDWIESDPAASDGFAARINNEVSWQLQVEQPGEYTLWGRVQTFDSQHDSFYAESAKQLPDGSFMHRSMSADWNLGVRADWTWVRLPIPICLEKGIWQLTLKPREYEGRIDQLFLTIDPATCPP